MPRYVQPTPPIEGWMSDHEMQWLFERAGLADTIVEVGSWFGRSTHALLSGCSGTVYAVDHFLGSPSEMDGPHKFAKNGDVYEQFFANVGGFPNLKVIRCPSVSAATHFLTGSVDMVFIDGEHTYDAALSDLEAWGSKVKSGGMFCGHDKDFMDVPRALKKYFGSVPEAAAGSIWMKVV